MLTHLNIHNYALISDLDIDFEAGFSVMTGETGAGKSIILGALALLMGARADIGAITEGEQKCIIEGDFDLNGYGLESFFRENELDYSHICTIRRELLSSGKSRSFINDTPVTLNILKPLANRLIDIHSQHENLLLSDESFCLSIVDSLAKNTDIKEAYAEHYKRYRTTEAELQKLRKEAEEAQKNADFNRYQYETLSNANLEDGELQSLEEEQSLLAHAEDIREKLYESINYLRTEDGDGAVSAVKSAMKALLHIEEYLPTDEQLTQRLESAYLELADIADSAERMLSTTEADPRRLEDVEGRMSVIQNLLRKFSANTEADLIALRDELEKKIQRQDSYDFDIANLEKRLQKEHEELCKQAGKLTSSRKAVEPIMKTNLEQMLTLLGVAHASIALQISPLPDYTETGHDEAVILFAANLGQSPRPVAEVASGGEMARLMLSIKALLADTQGLPTIIFDEVDTGVSGEVALQMGKIMQQIAKGRQIISITHLPQIASLGEKHYKVYKQDTDKRTETHIRRLSEAERPTEIAALLSGSNITQEAIANAQQLLKKR